MGYLAAGYALTWSVLIWYVWRVGRRYGRARRALAEERRNGPDPRPPDEQQDEQAGAA